MKQTILIVFVCSFQKKIKYVLLEYYNVIHYTYKYIIVSLIRKWWWISEMQMHSNKLSYKLRKHKNSCREGATRRVGTRCVRALTQRSWFIRHPILSTTESPITSVSNSVCCMCLRGICFVHADAAYDRRFIFVISVSLRCIPCCDFVCAFVAVPAKIGFDVGKHT